jgi:hypothetical protein
MEPDASAVRGYRLAIAHCRIELAAPDELGTLEVETDARSDSQRERILVARLRLRAFELYHAGDPVRAARLLRLLATADPAIAETYAHAIDPQPVEAGPTPVARDPLFLAALGALDIDHAKRRFRGRRVMLAFRRASHDPEAPKDEPPDLLARSAERFGLTVGVVDVAPPGSVAAELPTRLHKHVTAFRPDLIVFDGLFGWGPWAEDETAALHLATVLGVARRYLGTKVVNSVADPWRVSDRTLFAGLGSSVDLVQHCHPTGLGRGTATEAAAVFCYVPPLELPSSTAEPGNIAKACFVGSITDVTIGRLVWWAECAARGLPLAIVQTDPAAPDPPANAAFADQHRAHRLSLSFTRRTGGPPSLTAGTILALLAGGVVLEERSVDSAYFLKPGTHYLPFETLTELAAMIDRLLDAPEERARLAEAGRAWAQRYFTGDYFWAGLLQRAFESGR